MYDVKNLVVYDVETYPNYFLVGFKLPSGEVYQYGFTEFDISQIHGLREFINWVEQSPDYNLSGFNSSGYDDPVLSEFLRSPCVDVSYATSRAIIDQGVMPYNFTRDVASIDLMQVMPVRLSLKKAGVCMRHKKLQELPFDPYTPLSTEAMAIIANYNINDLEITQKLTRELEEELQLRHELSNEYGVDLRSKGRATCAELILCSVMQKRTGLKKSDLKKIARDNVDKNPTFNVKPPEWFQHLPVDRYPSLKSVIDKADEIYNRRIHVYGYKLEKGCLTSTLFIGDRWYNMGIGGLHSMDGAGAWVPDENSTLMDVDVTSYYPELMLTQNLSPRHWIIDGVDHFRETFGNIVTTRVASKKTDPPKAKRLKIVINGTFGKTNDPFSAFYDPYIMASVTVTGQVALIALVAMVHDVGGNVISANTDGITILYDNSLAEIIKNVVSEWEALTKLNMEYCEYSAFYQKDVNNYLACPKEGDLKTKGIFNIPELGGVDMEHTPMYQIVARAVRDKLEANIDMTETITQCKDIQEFLLTQNASRDYEVTWRGKPVGNMVRFYKSTNGSEIIKTPKEGYVGGKTGTLSNSESSVPLPDLPDSFESITDLDYNWYINEAEKLLALVTKPKVKGLNKIARNFELQGLTPALIPKGDNNRISYVSGGTDFSSILDTETLAVCTGRNYGVIAQRFITGETYFYQVDRKYKSRTRPCVMKDNHFEFIYSSNIEAAPDTILRQIDQDWLEQFYTESELRLVRSK